MIKTTGDKIRQLRTRQGLSLAALGEMSDCTQGHIWAIENGKSTRPSANVLNRIALSLHTTMDYLLNPGVKTEDATDQAFFDLYKGLDQTTKDRVRATICVMIGKTVE